MQLQPATDADTLGITSHGLGSSRVMQSYDAHAAGASSDMKGSSPDDDGHDACAAPSLTTDAHSANGAPGASVQAGQPQTQHGQSHLQHDLPERQQGLSGKQAALLARQSGAHDDIARLVDGPQHCSTAREAAAARRARFSGGCSAGGRQQDRADCRGTQAAQSANCGTSSRGDDEQRALVAAGTDSAGCQGVGLIAGTGADDGGVFGGQGGGATVGSGVVMQMWQSASAASKGQGQTRLFEAASPRSRKQARPFALHESFVVAKRACLGTSASHVAYQPIHRALVLGRS